MEKNLLLILGISFIVFVVFREDFAKMFERKKALRQLERCLEELRNTLFSSQEYFQKAYIMRERIYPWAWAEMDERLVEIYACDKQIEQMILKLDGMLLQGIDPDVLKKEIGDSQKLIFLAKQKRNHVLEIPAFAGGVLEYFQSRVRNALAFVNKAKELLKSCPICPCCIEAAQQICARLETKVQQAVFLEEYGEDIDLLFVGLYRTKRETGRFIRILEKRQELFQISIS